MDFPGTKTCRICNKLFTLGSFYRNRRAKSGLQGHCKFCQTAYCKRRKNNPRERMLWNSRNNARAKGVTHDIEAEDIPLPTHCVYLGVLLEYGSDRGWNTPSIDRIDPKRGYVKDNIQVISNLANRMKTNATEEQLVAFARGVLKIHEKLQLVEACSGS